MNGKPRKRRYITLPNQCISSENFASLSPHANKLFLDLAAKCYGYNNGDMNMVWPEMKERDWSMKNGRLRVGTQGAGHKGQQTNGQSCISLAGVPRAPIRETAEFAQGERSPTNSHGNSIERRLAWSHQLGRSIRSRRPQTQPRR